MRAFLTGLLIENVSAQSTRVSNEREVKSQADCLASFLDQLLSFHKLPLCPFPFPQRERSERKRVFNVNNNSNTNVSQVKLFTTL